MELHHRAMSKSGRGEKHTSTVLKQMLDDGEMILEVKESRAGKSTAVFIQLADYEAPLEQAELPV